MSTRPLVDADVIAAAARPLPVVVIFDWSWSMRGYQAGIDEALRQLPDEFDRRTVLRNSAEVALITMGPEGHDGVLLRTGDAEISPHGFVRVPDFVAPTRVDCEGITRLDSALGLAVDMLERRCREFNEAGRAIYRPYVAIISDGDPTDEHGDPDDISWRPAADRMSRALGGRVIIEAFVPQGSERGILAELVGGEDHVHEFDPLTFADVVEAVSFSAEQGATQGRSAASVVRDDLAADREAGADDRPGANR